MIFDTPEFMTLKAQLQEAIDANLQWQASHDGNFDPFVDPDFAGFVAATSAFAAASTVVRLYSITPKEPS